MLQGGSRTLRVLLLFGLCVTSIVGVLPHSGAVQVTQEVRKFVACQNRFTGALPDGGMRAMMSVTTFEIYINSFAGSLPDGGVRAMVAVTSFE
eukprot:5433123-Amphidinium_carterae.1